MQMLLYMQYKICWYERTVCFKHFPKGTNLTTPSTKRNIIVPCTLEVTINFSCYITALKSEFKKLRWLLQQKRQLTVKLQVRLLGYSMLVTLCKISEVYFCLLAANNFRVKTKNGRFTSTGSCCRKKLQYENLTSLFCRLGQKLPQKACSAIIFFIFTFNQGNH